MTNLYDAAIPVTGTISDWHNTISDGFAIFPQPPSSLVFGNGSSISWEKGKLEFKGEMEESAKAFFEFLKPYLDSYLQLHAPYNNLDYLAWLYERKNSSR